MLERTTIAFGLALSTACHGTVGPGGGAPDAEVGRDAAREDSGARDAGAPSAADGGVDAGVVEATDAGGASGAVDCDSPSLLFCDEFEDDDLGAKGWRTIRVGGATIGLDREQVHSGEQALHIHMPNEAGAFVTSDTLPFFPLASDVPVYGRVFMYTAGVHPDKHGELVKFGVGDNSYRNSIDTWAQEVRLFLCDGPGDSRCEAEGGPVPEVDRWVCLEWHFDRAADRFELWLDGESVASSTWEPDGTFTSVTLGHSTWQVSTTGDAFDVWYDDFVIDDARVGCR
jgi:hypothetical protein